MNYNFFISYCHEDESYKNELIKSLTPLKREGFISIWHDRVIYPSDTINEEILQSLNDSHVVILLMSRDFIASDYCYEREMKTALENFKLKKTLVLPIIVRDCDWLNTPIAEFSALPKDGLAIAKWIDKDEAWQYITNEIRRLVESFDFNQKTSTYKIQLSKYNIDWIDNTEVELFKCNSKLKLKDYFVEPDLEYRDSKNKDAIKRINLYKVVLQNDYIIIFGSEQQGKTALLKMLTNFFTDRDQYAYYLDCSEINVNNPIEYIDKLNNKLFLSEVNPDTDKILLLDNFEKFKLNDTFSNEFIRNCELYFKKIIITCHSNNNFVIHEYSSLSNYENFKLSDFGHVKREQLIKRWNCIDCEETIEEGFLYSSISEIASKLNTMIRRNIVPAKPLFLLVMLQSFNSLVSNKNDLTSYGHVYLQLIYNSFTNANIKTIHYETYINLLTELAWWILIGNNNLSTISLSEFFDKYQIDFLLPLDKNEMIETLIEHSILNFNNNKYSFNYPYIYYYFAGKKIADYYNDNASENIRKKFLELIENLQREDFSNILIFVTHHTKETWILDKIKEDLNSLFCDHEESTLNKNELIFMDQFIKTIPQLVLENRVIPAERQSKNEKLDRIQDNTVSDNTNMNDIAVDDPQRLMLLINRTFRGMEIAGQIIRNRHSSMKISEMKELANTGINSGLRFLNFFINFSEVSKKEVVRLILESLSNDPDLSDHDLRKYIETAYLHMVYGGIFGILNKISSTIGSKDALTVYEQLESEVGTPALILLKVCIELRFNNSLNFDSIYEASSKIHNNATCSRILKEMVIQHIYMFPVHYKVKQQLSDLLGISMDFQHQIDKKLNFKA